MQADIKHLEETMKACDVNIKTFEEAIEKERRTIKEWQAFKDDPNSSFPAESLDRGIDRCKNNIKTFEEAIEKEYDTKSECRYKMDAIGEKEHIEKLKADGITIDAKESK